jgi:hypothetical protein
MLDIAADASLDEVIGLLDRSAAKRLATTPALLIVGPAQGCCRIAA